MELASRIPAEIISLDSIAVYREMDIGTAKPSPADRQKIRHHGIDLVDPDQLFSVATYLRIAHAAVRDIRQRDKTPIFVGGTPMYLHDPARLRSGTARRRSIPNGHSARRC